MLWYEALVPAALIAIAVRWEAIFFLPYWSWLQLIPEAGTRESPKDTRRKRRSLMRRLAIPLVAGLLLVSVWPRTYGVFESGLVGVLAAGLLLWPLLFASYVDHARSPAWLAWLLYGLLPISFTASAVLGAIIGDAIRQRGGFHTFVADELISIVLTGVVLLFASAATDRVSQWLYLEREAELEEGELDGIHH